MRKIIILLFSICFYQLPARAQDAPPEVSDAVVYHEITSQDIRGVKKYSVSADAALLSAWLPLKYGMAFDYAPNSQWAIEATYLQASYGLKIGDANLGSISEQRYGVIARYYGERNSFNLSFGIAHHNFKAGLGSAMLSRVAGAPSVDFWKFESTGLQFGLGNRWQWDNGFTLGVDWFNLYWPLTHNTDRGVIDTVTDATDKQELNDAVDLVSKMPLFDIIKLQIGYSF